MSTTSTPRILLISGSLRRRSTNTALLRTAHEVSPSTMVTVLYDEVGLLPHFNPDDDIAPLDPAVARLRAEIRDADAVLFSTPEYAGALPGSFKNLLDWTLGDDQVGSIYEKPAAWLNASARGANDAHDSLRKVLGYANATIIDTACAHIPVTSAMIGDDDLISEPAVRTRIVQTLTALTALTGLG